MAIGRPNRIECVMVPKSDIYEGDCLDVMGRMDEGSIDLIVTSPPYHLKKKYERDVTFDDYCSMMESSLVEWNRVLKPGGYAVVNFGDYFNSGNRFYTADVPACYPASINYFRWGVEVAGMDLQATRIWRKQFARMGIPFVCNNHPRGVFDYEHIWTFRKRNGSKAEFVNDRKLSQRGVVGEEWRGSAGIDKHCAAFPVGLPKWAIEVYSQPGDIVLDPFGGSGTTGLACMELDRRFVLIEKNAEYCGYARERLGLTGKEPGGVVMDMRDDMRLRAGAAFDIDAARGKLSETGLAGSKLRDVLKAMARKAVRRDAIVLVREYCDRGHMASISFETKKRIAIAISKNAIRAIHNRIDELDN